MARNKNRSRRDTHVPKNITNPRLPSFYNLSPSLTPYTKNPVLTYYEDRRQWHPEGAYRPAASWSQARHRLTLLDQPKRSQQRSNSYSSYRYAHKNYSNLTHRIGFQNPERVLVCVRRSIRREVLHAFKKTGRRGQRRPRYSYYSSISCRR